jgi:uncharacterized protein YfaS (alpha-2-macroglobulin family)
VTTATAAVRVPLSLTTGGSYILRAEAADERGRRTRTDVRFYAIGGGISEWRANGNRIDITPERVAWAPGETARVLVQSPWPRAIALVTKEREGIKTYREVEIRSTQDTVDIPISEADIPNVYVSVVLIKGRTPDSATASQEDPGKPAFRVGYTELTVSDVSKRLHVDVKADRDEYRPRDQVNVAVNVRDASDRSRQSEVTLWAVDYGLLSWTGYDVPDVAHSIYARKRLQVQTEDNRLRLIGKRSIVSEQRGGLAGGLGGPGRGAAVPRRGRGLLQAAGLRRFSAQPGIHLRGRNDHGAGHGSHRARQT